MSYISNIYELTTSFIFPYTLFWKDDIKYLNIPVGYRLYDRSQIKLEIVTFLIKASMSLLHDYQIKSIQLYYVNAEGVFFLVSYHKISI